MDHPLDPIESASRDLNITFVEYWLGFNGEEYYNVGLTVSGTHHNVFPASNSDVDRDCVKLGKLDGTDEQIERVSCADMYFPLCQRPLRLAPTQVFQL